MTQFQGNRSAESYTGLGEIPCRDELLVTGFAPGAYRLLLTLMRAGGEPERGAVPFVIDDENVKVDASLARPVSMEGAFIATEGSRLPDLSAVTVMWDPGGGRLNASYGPVKPDTGGRFELSTFLTESRRLIVSRVAGAYVREIRYNGIPVKGDLVPLDNGAMKPTLTIVLDDKPSAIVGEVRRGGNPAANAAVMLARWPLPPPEMRLPSDLLPARGDGKGRFQVGNLAPGEYRIMAVAINSLLTDPPFERIWHTLAESNKIDLQPGATLSVNLEEREIR